MTKQSYYSGYGYGKLGGNKNREFSPKREVKFENTIDRIKAVANPETN